MKPLFKVWLYQPPASRLKKQQAESGIFPIKIVCKRMQGLDERFMQKTNYNCTPEVFKAIWPKAGDSVTKETIAIKTDPKNKKLIEGVNYQLKRFEEIIEGVTLENCARLGLTSVKAIKRKFEQDQTREILKMIPTPNKDRSLNYFLAIYLREFRHTLRASSVTRTTSAVMSFNKYGATLNKGLQNGLITIDAIDVDFMRGWEKYMYNPKNHRDNKRRTKITVRGYAKNLLSILNEAAKTPGNGYTKEMIPIGIERKTQWQMPSPSRNEATIHKYLDEVDLQKFKDYQPTSPQLELAKDVWFLAYYGGGCYMIDIINWKKDHLRINDNRLVYYRVKNDGKSTSSVGIVPLRKEFLKLVEKYKDDDSEFLLNFHKRYLDIEKSSGQWRKFLSKYWNRIAETLEFKTSLNLQMARHTCHTNLQRAGGSYLEILEISQHKSEQMLQNYLHQFNNKRMEELYSKI